MHSLLFLVNTQTYLFSCFYVSLIPNDSSRCVRIFDMSNLVLLQKQLETSLPLHCFINEFRAQSLFCLNIVMWNLEGSLGNFITVAWPLLFLLHQICKMCDFTTYTQYTKSATTCTLIVKPIKHFTKPFCTPENSPIFIVWFPLLSGNQFPSTSISTKNSLLFK